MLNQIAQRRTIDSNQESHLLFADTQRENAVFFLKPRSDIHMIIRVPESLELVHLNTNPYLCFHLNTSHNYL